MDGVTALGKTRTVTERVSVAPRSSVTTTVTTHVPVDVGIITAWPKVASSKRTSAGVADHAYDATAWSSVLLSADTVCARPMTARTWVSPGADHMLVVNAAVGAE